MVILTMVAMKAILQDSAMLLTPLKNNEFQVHFPNHTVPIYSHSHSHLLQNDKPQFFHIDVAFAAKRQTITHAV